MRNFQGQVYAVAEQAVYKVVYKPQASNEGFFCFFFYGHKSKDDRLILWVLELSHFHEYGKDLILPAKKQRQLNIYVQSLQGQK